MQNVSNIIAWYKKKSRKMPWRDTNDPYKIWISEVILQQTQVVTGLKYYEKIISKFSTIRQMAMASEHDLLLLWKGLGYYSRARNMHKTAKIIFEQQNAVFPSNYKDLLLLPGIGDYTASAILSFAFNQSYPCLDGNVYRLLSRIYNIKEPIDVASNKQIFKQILNEWIVNQNPADFNNALMELGATVCKPANPDCLNCPAQHFCLAFKNKNQEKFPVKSKKIKKKIRYFNYFLVEYQSYIYIVQRTNQDIWNNLYELPLIESKDENMFQQVLNDVDNQLFNNNALSVLKKLKEVRHSLTHQTLEVQFWNIKCQNKPEFKLKNCLMIKKKDYTKFPMPILVHNFLLSL
jgi:A/G-specific adenine glycosylase